jgi:hypothetical protein
VGLEISLVHRAIEKPILLVSKVLLNLKSLSLDMIGDYGLADRLRAIFSASPNLQDTEIDDKVYGESQHAVFLPWTLPIKKASQLGLIPENSHVYTSPDGLVNPNPVRARQLQTNIVDKALEGTPYETVLGYSVGNWPAVELANQCDVQHAVLAMPGAKLGSSLYEGIMTQSVALKSQELGYRRSEAYDKVIGDTNPIKNVSNLPSRTHVILARHDKYIPFRHGKRFAEAAKSAVDATTKIYQNKGHLTAHLSVANSLSRLVQ